MKCSIVMSTKNKAEALIRTIQSIRKQKVPFDYELIVVDDGSDPLTDEYFEFYEMISGERCPGNTQYICEQEGCTYIRLENNVYRNPSLARNVGYRAAIGDIIIAQSDEVIHHTPNAIEILCEELHRGEFLLSTVYDYDVMKDYRKALYVGNDRQRPFFFLGSLWRKDLYIIGGNDEEFITPGYDDDWFAQCLMKGINLTPRFLDSVIGYHQAHRRSPKLERLMIPSYILYNQKIERGVFIASGGPWEYEEKK